MSRRVLWCGLALMCMTAVAQTIPAPPKAPADVFPELRFKNTEGARRVFLPMWGTTPVEYVEAETGGYVKLPLNFTTITSERASWDIQLKADLSNARGIEFDFYCADLDSASQLIAYLRSGNGWYRISFGVKHIGRWQHVVLSKSNASMEGSPDGWGKISTVRLSAWRNQNEYDSVAAIANIRPAVQNADVLVIMAASCVSPNDPESKGYASYAAAFAQSLEDLGIEAYTTSDLDVTEQALAKTKIAVLPYNPRVPEGLLEKLDAFVKRGGKVIACYNIAKGVDQLLGIKRMGWQRSSQGRFQGMKATADAIPMQPDIAYQASPHTTVAELAGPGKVIAKWCEPDGTDSGLAAATATSAGVFLGHVWFDASGKNVKQFLLSLVNYLAPDIWKKSAANWLEAIGVIENYTGLEDIRSKFAKDASMEAKSALAAAFELREKARGALAEARWVECIKLCEDAQNKVIEALCRQVKPVEGEQRGFWCHSAFGLPGNNWDESIKFLVDNGFNTILPNMLWGGMAYYKSDVLPTYANYAKQGDQVRQCLDACKKYGVKCHVWKVNWNMGSHLDKAFVEKMKAEKRTQVLFNGEQKDTWLCPSNPLNRRQEADAMLELVRNYPDLDGIHFDYIRYPDSSSCFCDGCRARFEERIGKKVENWPADTRSDALKNEWLQFRRDNITALVKLVHDEAKALRPTIQISAALFGNWMSDRDGVGQDWELWCRNGWLDFACPMDYVDSAVAFKGKVKRQIAWAHDVKLCPGIGLSCWTKPQDPLNMIEQIQTVRDLGLKGYTVFNFDNYARAVLPSLRLGCTSK